MPNMDYVSLHTHTTFSTADGYKMPSVHVKRWHDLGMKGGAFTEHGNVSSWVALEQQCEKYELEPIFGIEAYISEPGQLSKTHMILLAMNSIGLQNINRLVTRSFKQFYKFPTMYSSDLKEFNEGIIALSGCSDSALNCIMLGGKYFGEKTLECPDRNFQRAIKGVEWFKKVFGDRYYLEVQRFPNLDRTCALNQLLAKLSKQTGVSLVATSDVHYPFPEQNKIQALLHAARWNTMPEFGIEASWEYTATLTYPQSDKEIMLDLEHTFGDNPYGDMLAINAVLETKAIAKRCEGVRLPKTKPPKYIQLSKNQTQGYPVYDQINPEEELQKWISEGWKYRLEHNKHIRADPKKYKERMRYEYETICAREGFADYFLIVADLVQWAKRQGIAVGPGRGSSVGSLICYLLRITEIDSMQFPVLFERFLDPTRTDPPDIDIDFETDRRDEVFVYAAEKYGEDKVGNILTFTRYHGKSALDDVARVYRIPKWKIDAVKSKLLDRAEGHPRLFKTLIDTFNTFPEIAQLVQETPELALAAQLEGDIRSYSVHAAGMVVAGGDEPLNDICATYERELNGRITQAIPYNKHDAAYLKMLKIDALSLINMSEIASMCRDIGMKLEDLYRVELNDEKVLKLFRDGNVLGIFQFEGVATRRVLKSVQPTKFQHLADINALVRPGANDKGYIKNKNAGVWDAPVHEIISEHTDWTYGVITYEEQILMILRDLGGFEPAELNRMRKIIHDKLGSTVFNEYYQRFIKGAAAHNLSEEFAKTVWNGMVSASGYAFNIAHSVSYSHIAYWLGWLKCYATPEFYRGKLNKCEKEERRTRFVAEAEQMGIHVTPPRLMVSGLDWTLNKINAETTEITAGLMAVPGIGPSNALKIIEWRKEVMAEMSEPWEMDEYDWEDLSEVKGFGPKKIAALRAFADNEDPFGVHKTRNTLNSIRDQFSASGFAGISAPTHESVDIPKEREFICYMGIVRKKKYYDAVEQLQKRSTEDLEYDEAKERLDDNHLIKYCNLTVEDEHGEPVTVAISRWVYPRYQNVLQHIKINSDVVVAQGYSSDFGGIRVQAKNLTVLNPQGG